MNKITTENFIDYCNASVNEHFKACAITEEIGNRLFENLEYVNLEPKSILNLGSKDDFFTRKLAEKYPDAEICAIENNKELKEYAEKNNKHMNIEYFEMKDFYQKIKNKKFDLIFSNCTITFLKLDETLIKIYKLLNKKGLLLFSTLGPDTLQEFKKITDIYINKNFIDMHDIGDILKTCRLSDPVIHNERIKFLYRKLETLDAEIENGLINLRKVIDSKNKGNTALNKLELNNYKKNKDSLYEVTIEAIFAHCWMPINKIEILEQN